MSKKKDFEEWFSKGTVIVLPVCLVGVFSALADLNSPAPREKWWGWVFLLGLAAWFFVVPAFRKDR